MSDIDWKNPFRGSDFESMSPLFSAIHAASKANARFQELLKEAPEVFGAVATKKATYTHWCQQRNPPDICKKYPDTHKARLVAIEEIEE